MMARKESPAIFSATLYQTHTSNYLEGISPRKVRKVGKTIWMPLYNF